MKYSQVYEKMSKEIEQAHKPIIETIINTTALALTSFAVINITTRADYSMWYGYLALLVGMGLEFFKYWGRSKKLW